MFDCLVLNFIDFLSCIVDVFFNALCNRKHDLLECILLWFDAENNTLNLLHTFNPRLYSGCTNYNHYVIYWSTVHVWFLYYMLSVYYISLSYDHMNQTMVDSVQHWFIVFLLVVVVFFKFIDTVLVEFWLENVVQNRCIISVKILIEVCKIVSCVKLFLNLYSQGDEEGRILLC